MNASVKLKKKKQKGQSHCGCNSSKHSGKPLQLLIYRVCSYLDVLGKGFIELLVIVLVLTELSKQFQAFLHNVLSDHLQNFALLQHLSGDVQRKILRVDHTTDEV